MPIAQDQALSLANAAPNSILLAYGETKDDKKQVRGMGLYKGQ
jgi:hypothetical protein